MSSGTVLLAGGDGIDLPNSPIAGAQMFYPTTGTFFSVPSMQTARTDFSLGVQFNSDEVLAPGGAAFAGGSYFEHSLSASEYFTPGGGRRILTPFCSMSFVPCEVIRQRSSHYLLSGLVAHAIVIAPFPRPPEAARRDSKAPVRYRVSISGLGDSWDAAIVDQDGGLLETQRGISREPQELTLDFKDSPTYEAVRDGSVIVFEMRPKAAIGRGYPVQVKAEILTRAIPVLQKR